jgi:hypothetical protein
MTWVRLALAAVMATAGGFFFHVYYGRGLANDYVQAQAAAGRLNDIVHAPYSTPVFLTALATALLPVVFKVALFVLIRDHLPGRSGVAKGLWYGLLLLAISDDFIRMPIMSVVVGNPVDVMLVQSAEVWVISFMTGLIIGILVPAGADQELRRAAGR